MSEYFQKKYLDVLTNTVLIALCILIIVAATNVILNIKKAKKALTKLENLSVLHFQQVMPAYYSAAGAQSKWKRKNG